MRELEKNKVTLWMVNPTATTEYIDSDGFYTGEFSKTFGIPVEIRLNLYPAVGIIVEQMFGKDASLDMIGVSNTIVLTKESLLFEFQPTANFDTTYDYTVDKIAKSLNSYTYGFKRRT